MVSHPETGSDPSIGSDRESGHDKSRVITVKNEKGEELYTRLTTGWRVCIDYRRLNEVIRKDHFPVPFIDQLLDRVSGHPFY